MSRLERLTASQTTAPQGLRPLSRAALTTAAPAGAPSLNPDTTLTQAPRGATPANSVALGQDAEAVQYADVTVNDQGQIVGADGRPYGGVELYYDAQGDRVLDNQRRQVDPHQIGNRPHQGSPTAAVLQDASNQGAVMLGPNNQLITADGQPFLDRELYYDPATDQVRDAQGATVDPKSLPGWLNQRQANPNDARTVRTIRAAYGAATGAFWLGVTGLRQRRSLTGMQGRVTGLQAASQAFQRGTSIQGRLAEVPVAGALARTLEGRRTKQITGLQRAITLSQATPLQEVRFRATERLGEMRADSRAFRQGHSLLGRVKDTPVLGSAAQAIEDRRRGQITRLSGELRRNEVQPGVLTHIRNATRGRIVPAALMGLDAYGIYVGVSRWNAPGNDRKWDDALRIGGNAVSATGNLMTMRRGDITNGLRTVMAGTVLSAVGHMTNDQH